MTREERAVTGRRRLPEIGSTREGDLEASPQEVHALLKRRAAELARRQARELESETLELVTFELAGELFGVEASQVRGMFRLKHLSPLPGTSPLYAGLTSWRGKLLPVLDLESLLGLERTGLDDRVWVMCIDTGDKAIGLLAGQLGSVSEVAEADLDPPDETRSRGGLVRGTTRDAVLVLDVPSLVDTLNRGGWP